MIPLTKYTFPLLKTFMTCVSFAKYVSKLRTQPYHEFSVLHNFVFFLTNSATNHLEN
jgi:hypothetical protein